MLYFSYKQKMGNVLKEEGVWKFVSEDEGKTFSLSFEFFEQESEVKKMITFLNKLYKKMELLGEESFSKRIASAIGMSFEPSNDEDLSGDDEKMFKIIETNPELFNLSQDICNEGMSSGLKQAKKRFVKIYDDVKNELILDSN